MDDGGAWAYNTHDVLQPRSRMEPTQESARATLVDEHQKNSLAIWASIAPPPITAVLTTTATVDALAKTTPSEAES